MDDLYVKITLQGLGWGKSAHPGEDIYLDIRSKIAETLSKDKRFTGEIRTATVTIRGYARPEKSVLVVAE